jgi:prepilin-type N-terminal cleavage/methylation domain-containing protein
MTRKRDGPPAPARAGFASAGFTLLEASIVLVIVGVIAGMVSEGWNFIETSRRVSTGNKLDTVENALLAYRLANNSLPCPGDPSLPNTNANYGVAAANPGSCTGGTPAIAAASTDAVNSVVEGSVPFKTLNLPEEFMYDGWERKFAYAVNTKATAANAMQAEPLTDICGISVTDAGGVAGNRTKGAFYTLVSFGADGHGGYIKSGTRLNAGVTNADELTNCHCNSSATATTYAASYVEKDMSLDASDAVHPFSDYVRFKERWQMMSYDDMYASAGTSVCNGPGFRINGSSVNGHIGWLSHGNIAGHAGTLRDLVISGPNSNGAYVIFGQQGGGYANPLNVGTLNGSNGTYIYDSSDSAISLTAVGDINGDGYDDIIMCDPGGGNCDIFYGHAPPFNASYDMATPSTCQWTNFIDGGGSGARIANAVIADVNNDGYKDIILGDWNANSSKGAVYIIFGRANTCPGSEYITAGMNISTLTSATTPKGSHILGESSIYQITRNGSLAVGDVNGDGINDVIMGTYMYNSGGHLGRLYIVAGQATWPNSIAVSGLAGIPNASPACSAASTTCGTVINGNGNGQLGGELFVADVYHTGFNAIVSDNLNDNNNQDNYVIKSSGAASWTAASYNLATLITGGSAYDFNSNSDQNVQLGGACYECGGGAWGGDVNNDGITDLLFSAPTSDGNPSAYGSVYVLFGGAGLMAGGDVYANPPNGTNGLRIDCPYSNPDYTGGNAPGSQTCGWNLEVADLNGDGINDIIIAVPGGSVTGSNGEGYVYVLYGKSTGWTATYNLGTIY